MDKSLLIQKTVRDNNEDLQNFMRDMKHWENDMKRKDAELSSKKESKQVLPAVRSKLKKEKKQPLKKTGEVKGSMPKRISSSDYRSWEKFDVEKACEEIDKAGTLQSGSESDSDCESETECIKLRQQALYEKEIGNECVKKGKWKEAIEHYTKAINCNNRDAIFYANRALCYLKISQFKAAEDDCTKSLDLDSQYVKAYQRRAAARIALKKIKEAQSDLNNILQLEPKNIQAKRDLEKLKSDENTAHCAPKTFNKKSGDLTSAPKISCDKKSESYPWDPVDPTRIIEAVHKPPHLRSKKPLKRIEIIDIDDLPGSSPITDKNKNLTAVSSTAKTPIIIDENVTASSKAKNCTFSERPINKSKVNIKEIDTVVEKVLQPSVSSQEAVKIEVPPPARTSVQFYLALKKLKDYPDLLFQYLKRIDGQNFPTIFQDSLESDAFSSIINILTTDFIKNNCPVSSYLYGLTNIRRFDMLVLFMSKKDKEAIKQLINYCSENQEISDNGVLDLMKKFNIPRS